MALNKYMHPNNVYKTRKPDFKSLSTKYDYFKEKVTVNDSGKVILDFKDPAALRALTQALLEDDFGLTVTMPLDRLIPTVPQRLNYILWLEDIVGKENGAKGIDIGTGSSCIYPLLGCRLNQWQFVASDIDDQNIHFANKNVASNKMEEKITIKKVTKETLLIGLVDVDETFDFSMCNPPFYSDHLEAQGITSSRNDDRSESSSVSTASEAESIAWGGEVRFVTQMIAESLILKNKIRVYTSLLGKKTSLNMLKDVLQKKKVPNYASTEFCQGRTMRWGIAWTFDETIKFPKSAFQEKNVKPPLSMVVPRSSAEVVGDYTIQAHTLFIIKQLEQLQIHFYTVHNGKFYTCFLIQAKENTWSHQRQRKRRGNKQQHDQIEVDESGGRNEKIAGSAEECDQSKTVVSTSTNAKTDGNIEDCELCETVQTSINSALSENIKQINCDQSECDASSTNTNAEVAGNIEHTTMDVSETEDVRHSENESTPKMSDDKVDNSVLKTDNENVKVDNPAGKVDPPDVKVDNADVKDLCRGFVQEPECKETERELKEVSEKGDGSVSNEEESRKRSSSELDTETESKRSKPDHPMAVASELKGNGALESNSITANMDETGIKSDGTSNTLVRKDVIQRFWNEQKANSDKRRKKKAEKSFYETLEPFKDDEECLLLSKMVLRKEEGIISFSLTHMAGTREAMHQIMQYFRNKLFVKPQKT